MLKGMLADVNQLLHTLEAGEAHAAENLLPLVYQELRKLAASKMAKIPPGHTLQATALVHEAWMRVQQDGPGVWNSRGHFFSAAAEAMRRILVEQARRKSRRRHGGEWRRLDMEEVTIVAQPPEDKIICIHEALDQLAEEDAMKAEIVKLKFFTGLKNEEISAVLNLSEKTVRRHWNASKIRLLEMIESANQ